MSTDLDRWWTSSRGVDYRVVDTQNWTPSGHTGELTRVTVEWMDQSSLFFADNPSTIFSRLMITPVIE